MFWHAEGIKTEYSGTIWLDGEEYEVIPEKSYGYADKNWGGDFTSPWLWISSCNITSLITGKKLNNSAFEAGGGKPKAFGISCLAANSLALSSERDATAVTCAPATFLTALANLCAILPGPTIPSRMPSSA